MRALSILAVALAAVTVQCGYRLQCTSDTLTNTCQREGAICSSAGKFDLNTARDGCDYPACKCREVTPPPAYGAHDKDKLIKATQSSNIGAKPSSAQKPTSAPKSSASSKPSPAPKSKPSPSPKSNSKGGRNMVKV
ncbi:hypothetical protein BT63DRAFT_450749 [Microthyrium microscopicum]|uniref:Uncharacterized protein n=1 Tax=Microthyrium microscopicum TaxID=703497 RepID=A0A6A6UMP5_9PEZI|nr:hypothetical protein BT63DRAFT_450749 [Microthyrium microscopicum]